MKYSYQQLCSVQNELPMPGVESIKPALDKNPEELIHEERSVEVQQ